MQSKDNSWDFAPVKQEKFMDHQRCQQMYWNLIKKLDNDSQIEAATFVALLAGTKRCDEIGRNLYHVREAVYTTMEAWEKNSYTNVLKNQVQDKDRDAAYRTMEDYNDWTQNELVNSLNFLNRLNYHILYRAERRWATIGILALSITTSKTINKRVHI